MFKGERKNRIEFALECCLTEKHGHDKSMPETYFCSIVYPLTKSKERWMKAI